MLKSLQRVQGRPGLSIVISLGLILLVCFALRIIYPSRDPQIEQLRKRGFPVTLQELNDFYPALDPKQNSALDYAKCFSTPLFLSPGTNAQSARKWLPARGEPLGKEAAQEMRSWLLTNQQAFRILHQATGPARYPIDLGVLPKLPMPHLWKIGNGGFLLSSEALFQAGNNDAEAAVEALLASQRLADSLLLEPLRASWLARCHSLNTMLRRLERVMSLVPLNEAQLLRLEASLARAETNDHLVRALAGETALRLDCFLDSRHQSQIFFSRFSSRLTVTERLRNTAELSFLKVTGCIAKDRRFFLDSMNARLAAAELPFPQRFVSGTAAETNLLQNQYLIFSWMLLSQFGNLADMDARHIALLRAARTAIAIERFRLAHEGRLPEDLKDLVPDFLPSIPQDPFTGSTLRYVPAISKYTVYSVNADLCDDGGLEVEPNRGGTSDLIFSIQTPSSSGPR